MRTREGEPDCRPVIISRRVETCRDCGLSVLNDPPMLNVIGAKKAAVPVHASTGGPRAVHFALGKVKGRPCDDPRRPIHANFIAFLAQEAKLKKVPYASLCRRLDVPTFRDGPLRNR